MMTKRLSFDHGVEPSTPLHVETDQRERIKQHIQSRTGWDDKLISQMFRGYDVINTAMNQMGISGDISKKAEY